MTAMSRAAWIVTALSTWITAGAAPEPAPTPPIQNVTVVAHPAPLQVTSLQQLDDALDGLRRTSWQLASNFGTLRDARGRTPGQDVDQWLLTPAHLEALERLRATAAARSAKGDQRGLMLALGEATPLVAQETYMGGALTMYWRMWNLVQQHGLLISAIVGRISPPPAVTDTSFDMIASRVGQDLPKVMAAESPGEQSTMIEWLNNGHHDLVHALNEARQRYARQLSEQQRRQGQEAVVYPRDTPCPDPVPLAAGVTTPAGASAATPSAASATAATATAFTTTTRRPPRFAENNQAPDSFYPDSSRRAEFEGSVTVRAWVSATGCMQKAAIYSSSGVPELDDAAMRWTQQARFHPAEEDHSPVDGTTNFIVKFQLRQ